MTVLRRIAAALPLALAVLPAAAPAQSKPSFGVEVTTDERRRGLSWSGGDPSISADAALSLAGFEADARVAALRGSPRHAGADAVADLTLGKTWGVGGLSLRARAIGHLFAGAREPMDYWEVGGTASYTFGPLQGEAGVTYAPSQSAIGGSNTYAFVGASAGIPATPFTISASAGRSMGPDDRLRSARLRPGGDYTDWRIGVEHITGPLTLGVDYVGTDVPRGAAGALADAGNSGDRLLARARLSF